MEGPKTGSAEVYTSAGRGPPGGAPSAGAGGGGAAAAAAARECSICTSATAAATCRTRKIPPGSTWRGLLTNMQHEIPAQLADIFNPGRHAHSSPQQEPQGEALSLLRNTQRVVRVCLCAP